MLATGLVLLILGLWLMMRSDDSSFGPALFVLGCFLTLVGMVQGAVHEKTQPKDRGANYLPVERSGAASVRQNAPHD